MNLYPDRPNNWREMYTVVSLVSCFITRTHTGLSHYQVKFFVALKH